MAAILLKDVGIIQEYYCHYFGVRHTPVHAGVQGNGTSNQRAMTTVGGQLRSKPLPICTPGKTPEKKKIQPESPHKDFEADVLR